MTVEVQGKPRNVLKYNQFHDCDAIHCYLNVNTAQSDVQKHSNWFTIYARVPCRCYNKQHLFSKIITDWSVTNTVFRDVTLFRLTEVCRRFRGFSWLHQTFYPLNYRYTFTRLHEGTLKRTEYFIGTAVRNSTLISWGW